MEAHLLSSKVSLAWLGILVQITRVILYQLKNVISIASFGILRSAFL